MRSLRILKICNLAISDLISDFYRRHPEVMEGTYAEHKQKLIEFSPVHLNGFSEYMRNLGHECEEVVWDLQTLQHQWAEENNALISGHQWQLNILMQQIEAYKPEVLYLQDRNGLPAYIRSKLKDWLPYIKKIIMIKGSPGEAQEFRDLDLVIGALPFITRRFRDVGIHGETVYHAFDTNILKHLKIHYKREITRDLPFTFCGYSGFGGYGVYHSERYDTLRGLAKTTDIQLWITEERDAKNPTLNDDAAPLKEIHSERCRPARFGSEMHRIIAGSKLAWHRHGDKDKLDGEVGAMRLFEVTGLGACLMTDNGNNMHELFEADSEVVTYSSTEECIEKAKYLQENETECNKIAAAGQRRTLKDHTLEKRCELISSHIQKLFD